MPLQNLYTVLIVLCDKCNMRMVIHAGTYTHAVKTLCEDHGWQYTTSGNGQVKKVLCRKCFEQESKATDLPLLSLKNSTRMKLVEES